MTSLPLPPVSLGSDCTLCLGMVWKLVQRPKDRSVVGTKWVFRNKLDESGSVVRNKAKLVAKGYSQSKGIDYDETSGLVARLEVIGLLLAYVCYNDFKLFQIDVKSAFLNGEIKEEVYVDQPLEFEDSKKHDHVYKLDKALYGLKQAPRAWYERLSQFLIEKGYRKGNVDTTLFLKENGTELLVVQIYVDDIIFGSTNNTLCNEFTEVMKDLSVCLCARYQSTPKESHLTHVKRIFRYVSGTTNLGLWYSKRSLFDLVGYSDADFAGCKIDWKSTSGTCKFLGDMLIS
ncbi:hypothetical protein MLD38_031816 [Melastoma candidum]|uniref:Uncharacterized protein n=1 Tax=Melastoma candidum TaxID=119954 RepID=A0ACB9MSA5_9MYRT|nr:hypothetical protein MLD38_031816 [Melastoma candidum]